MAKLIRTAQGKQIDVDHVRLQNEHVIAVGNMKVNARGDLLGPGGKVVKTKDQVMKEYYALNTPMATDEHAARPQPIEQPVTQAIQQPIQQEPVIVSDNSGLDDMDMGESIIQPVPVQPVQQVQQVVQPVVQQVTKPVVQQVTQPVVTEPPAFVPTKQILPGTPAPNVLSRGALASDAGIPTPPSSSIPMRGNLAGAVAKTATVTQTEKQTPKKAAGIQRF